MERNMTKAHISEIENKNPQYEQLLADIWVGIVLTLLLLSCVCCMCSCLLYHKFQHWKRSVLSNNDEPEIGPTTGDLDHESLPSYTLASGLPTYEEAIKRIATDKKPNRKTETSNASLRIPVTLSHIKPTNIKYLQNFIQEKT